jgi:DNA-binding CsgD family transcriptional regulator
MRSFGEFDWDARFQDAALDPGQWLTVLQELADATGSARAELVGFGDDLASFNWVTASDERMLADFHAIGGGSPDVNFRIAADSGTQPLEIVHEDHYDRARRSVVRDDYIDFCEQYQMAFGCQTSLLREEGGLVGLSILRSRSDGRTDEAHKRLFGRAARSAQVALRMQRAIEHQGFNLLAGTLEAMSVACVLLDGRGRAQSMTPAAETLLIGHPVIRLSEDRVTSTDPETRRQIEVALRSVLGPDRSRHARVPIYRESPVPEIVLDIFRLPAREWAMHFAPGAIVVLRDGRLKAGSEVLIGAFALTPAEAQVALGLCQGLNREAIAAARGVSLETLRTQVKSVYQKTGCRREAELVLLVQALLD